jgi:uncharacterized protein
MKRTRRGWLRNMAIAGSVAVPLAIATFWMGVGNGRLPTMTIETPGGRILVEVANNPAARAAGLSNRDALNSVVGLLLKWDTPGRHPIWMAGMRFSLDLVWIDAAGRIIAVLPNVPPCRSEPCPLYEPDGSKRSLAVPELSAVGAAHRGLNVGGIVQIQNLSHGE